MSGQIIRLRRSVPPAAAEELLEVTRVRDQAEALIVMGLLEAHAIRVVHRTRVAPSVHPFTVGEQAEVQILVPRDALTASRRLLRRATTPQPVAATRRSSPARPGRLSSAPGSGGRGPSRRSVS